MGRRMRIRVRVRVRVRMSRTDLVACSGLKKKFTHDDSPIESTLG